MDKIAVESSFGTPVAEDEVNQMIVRSVAIEPERAAKKFSFQVTNVDHVLRDFMKPESGAGDVLALDREELVFDDAKLQAAIDAGLRATPGIRIFEA